MRIKINLKVLFWEVLIVFFAFERYLTSISNIFSYIDELLCIIVCIGILIKLFTKKEHYKKDEGKMLIILMLIIAIGVIGNISSKLLIDKLAICIDIISTIKVWIAYFAIINIKKEKDFFDSTIKGLSRIFRFMLFIMLICLIISQISNIGMTGGTRYGIRSFKFLFNVPGNFSKLFYFLIPLLVADLYFKNNVYKKIMIGVALLIWVSTLRSRAISFSAIFVLLAIWFFKFKDRKKTVKIRIINILIFVAIAVCISWNQITFYFNSSTQARAVLLRYGIVTMNEYMPIGAGFGTYGSDVAAKYYSKLYIRYGFNRIYGMRENEELFLNDNYWPMIMGQLGLIGFILTLLLLYYFIKINIKETKTNRYFYFASFCAIGFLLLSSIASKSYSEYSSICVIMLNALLTQSARYSNIESDEIIVENNEEREREKS